MHQFKFSVTANLVCATLAAALTVSACGGARARGAAESGPPRGVSMTPVSGATEATGATPGALPPRTSVAGEDEREIRVLIARYAAAANARDLDAVMRLYAATDSVLVYDVSNAPFRGFAEVTRDWRQFMTAMRVIDLEFREIEVAVDAPSAFAYATFIERASLTPVQGAPFVNDNLRTTQIYKRGDRGWLIVHEHKSRSRNW